MFVRRLGAASQNSSHPIVRIGLLRHFSVDHPFPSGWRTAAELAQWRENYEQAATPVGTAELGGVDWKACLASDLPRARITARAIFRGGIHETELLREARFAEFRTGRLRLPVTAWEKLLRLAWMTGHSSQRACRDAFRAQVSAAADRVAAMECDTLVVSHMGVMIQLGAELCRRGFSGPRLRAVRHAFAYVYER